MGRFVGIELLKQAAAVAEARDVVAALIADPGVFGVLPLYLLAFAWLVHRFAARSRSRSRRRRHLRHGARVGTGLLRFLGTLAFLALGLLLGVARSAGRSTFHSGARF